MNTRPIIWISGVLNLALVAGVFVLLKSQVAAVRGTPAASQPAAATNAESQAPGTGPSGPHFNWSQLLSENLKVYRDNLLAAGCPGPTLRNIILGEINERFGQRRQNLLAEVQSQFWNFALRGETAIRNVWGQPMAALAAERQQVIDDVLGKDYGIAEAEMRIDREARQRHLSWLSAEKRDQLFTLEQRRQQRLAEWAKSVGQRPDGQLTAEDNARLQALQQEFEDAKKALLTPEELEEFYLRSSKESLWAAGLSGFEPSEAEWRTVTRLRVDFEEAQRNLYNSELSDEARRERLEELQAELTRGTKEALGGQFHQYELASDGQFQEVQKVTQRYGLSDNLAAQAYEVQQTALAQAQQVCDDASLSPEARQAALTALQQETERALARTLGERVLSTYKEYGGNWLKELNRNEAE